MPSPLRPLLLLLVALLPVASLTSMGKGPRLTLSPANVINAFGVPVSGGGAQGVGALLDEQALAGDPAAGTGGAVVSAWMPGYAQWYYPWVNALVDLGGTYALEQVRPHWGIWTQIHVIARQPAASQSGECTLTLQSTICCGLAGVDEPPQWRLQGSHGLW